MIVTSTTHILTKINHSSIHWVSSDEKSLKLWKRWRSSFIHPSIHSFILPFIHSWLDTFFLVVQYRDFPSTKWLCFSFKIYYEMEFWMLKKMCHTYNFVAINDSQLDTSHSCELIKIADPLLVKLLGGSFRSRSGLLKCLFTIACPFHLPRTMMMFNNHWRKQTN